MAILLLLSQLRNNNIYCPYAEDYLDKNSTPLQLFSIETVIGCVISEQIYSPFILLCWGLAILCFILRRHEPK